MYLQPGEDYRDGWHTIATEWAPGYLRYFFDGHLVGEYRTTNLNYRMIPILLNNYRPTDASPASQNFDIDCYRVWKNSDVVAPDTVSRQHRWASCNGGGSAHALPTLGASTVDGGTTGADFNGQGSEATLSMENSALLETTQSASRSGTTRPWFTTKSRAR